MLAAAAVLDLVHGGYFRARPTAIQFYAGPENAPEDWLGEFPDEEPPRVLVGEAEVDAAAQANEITVRLTVSNWAAVRSVKLAWERGEYRDRFERYVLDQEAALRGRPEDRAWLRAQFQRLRRHALGALIDEE